MIKEYVEKHKELISYIFFGACTTGVNTVLYSVLYYILGWSNKDSNVTAWLVSVLFAYITNRLWVFTNHKSGVRAALTELVLFFACRLLTGAADLGIMYYCVDIMEWNAFLMKCLSNILVIVLNYAASKLLIFKKGRQKRRTDF